MILLLSLTLGMNKNIKKVRKKKILHIHINYSTLKGCSRSNASYFVTLAHDIRGRCWWDGSRGWAFPSISHYIQTLQTVWHGSADEAKGVLLNSSMQKKWPPTDTHQHSLNIYGDQAVDVSTVRVGGAYQQWGEWKWWNGLPPLVQIFKREAPRLLFTTSENA